MSVTIRVALHSKLKALQIDNFAPTSPTVPQVAEHIAVSLKTPDFMFLQEIQDNSGSKDDGTVDANLTLSNLVAAIANASGGVQYSFIDINPIDGQDGGEPGGNIRQAYLCVDFYSFDALSLKSVSSYRADKFKLAGSSPVGGSLQATEVTVQNGQLGLSYVHKCDLHGQTRPYFETSV